MAQNGYGPAPVTGHMGRIPNYGKSHVNPMGSVEPPACIQNAMMTKDKKPFTYTPGGLDLSQIRTPSMARRMARQRSLEDQEQAYGHHQHPNNTGYHPQGGPTAGGGGIPPPPPPPSASAPPPPPPLVIQAPNANTVKPIATGERPEIVIPENPIGMLRKTNSPYHWEVEKEQMQRMGPVPKFVDKVPAPLTVKLPSQQAPPSYNSPQAQNNFQRQGYPYGNQNTQAPESPLHRPEAQYAHQNSNSPNVNGSPHTRDLLVRQDSQFNKSPQPFGNQSPVTNSSPYSPSPGVNWRQPEKRDSPANTVNISPQSPHLNRGPFSPPVQQSPPGYQSSPNPVFHTLPRATQRNQDNGISNTPNNYITNNVKEVPQQIPNDANSTPWRTNTLNRYPRGADSQNNAYNNSNQTSQQAYTPAWKTNDANNNRTESNYNPPWKQDNKVGNEQQSFSPPWSSAQDTNNNKIQDNYAAPWRSQNNQRSPPTSQEQPRYQSSISIPVSPRKHNTQPEYNNSPSQKEAVYVNQEPVYYCPDSPKTMPPWVKTQKEKTKTPPPAWCQRPLEGRKSLSRELVTPPRENPAEPEWVRKSNEIQRAAREVVSPPKYQQTAQPNWSTRPSENRRSLPRDNNTQGSRVIPIQMEVSSTETRDQSRQGDQHPQLRIVIDMKQNPEAQSQGRAQAPYSQPTQRIMRVLSPQLVRFDEGPAQPDLPTLNRTFQNNQDNQPKTRIIPIQIEGAGNGGANKSVYYHKITQEGAPRQSKAFRVLQVITGTGGTDDYRIIEEHHGFSDL